MATVGRMGVTVVTYGRDGFLKSKGFNPSTGNSAIWRSAILRIIKNL